MTDGEKVYRYEEIKHRMALFDKTMQSMMNHFIAENYAKLTDTSSVPIHMKRLFIGFEGVRNEFMKDISATIPDSAWPSIINDMAKESEGKPTKPRNFRK